MIKFLLGTILLVSMAFAVPPLPPTAALPSQQGLARLFFASRVTVQDPTISMACFADYIAHSNMIGETYSERYNKCHVDATSARELIDNNAVSERKDIEAASAGVCGRITTCNEHKSALEMFHCHENAGSMNTRDTYAISGNASEFSNLMQERYRLIDLSHEKCCHAAERVYVEETANNYKYLQSCLDGVAQPRPTSTSTSAPSTTEPTTTTSTTSTTTTTTTEAPPPTTTEEISETTETHQRMHEQFAQLLNLLN